MALMKPIVVSEADLCFSHLLSFRRFFWEMYSLWDCAAPTTINSALCNETWCILVIHNMVIGLISVT